MDADAESGIATSVQGGAAPGSHKDYFSHKA
jgi:hypothetical protein